jgi:hypothetical protein
VQILQHSSSEKCVRLSYRVHTEKYISVVSAWQKAFAHWKVHSDVTENVYWESYHCIRI